MLVGFLVMWVATTFGLWLVTRMVPGVRARSARSLWLAALVLGLINAFIRPTFYWLTLPLTILSFGIFALVINALLLKLVAWLVPDFEVQSFSAALLAALILALLGLMGIVLLSWWVGGGVTWSLDLPAGSSVYM